MKRRFSIATIIRIIFLVLITAACIFPFYVMIIMGTYKSEEIFKGIPLLPSNYLIQNFKNVYNSGFLRFYFNSFYISILASFFAVLFSAMAGFAFAKYKFKGKNILFNFVIVTLMIPTGLGVIGFIIEMREFGWVNTHLPLFMPWIASSFGVFLMTQFMKDGIPSEVLDSARIDGCSEPRIFMVFALNFVKPAALTLTLITFLQAWNNFLVPLIIINKQSLFTVPIGVFALGDLFRYDYGAIILALGIATIPQIIIFTIASKSFISGLTVGAIKG